MKRKDLEPNIEHKEREINEHGNAWIVRVRHKGKSIHERLFFGIGEAMLCRDRLESNGYSGCEVTLEAYPKNLSRINWSAWEYKEERE